MKRKYTPQEIEYIKENYSNKRTDAMAKHLNRTVSSVYNQAFNLGLKKSEEFLKGPDSSIFKKGSTTGSQYRYSKGNVPVNKGQKMPAAVYEKCAVTMFKKGNTPANHKPIGTERITDYGYTEVKIQEPNKWTQKHRLIYEKHYGISIPKGHKCIFVDGNKQNFAIENICVKSNAENMLLNTIHRYHEEIKSAIIINSKLSKTIKKLHNNG